MGSLALSGVTDDPWHPSHICDFRSHLLKWCYNPMLQLKIFLLKISYNMASETWWLGLYLVVRLMTLSMSYMRLQLPSSQCASWKIFPLKVSYNMTSCAWLLSNIILLDAQKILINEICFSFLFVDLYLLFSWISAFCNQMQSLAL